MASFASSKRLTLLLSITFCCIAGSLAIAEDEVRSLQYIETSGPVAEAPDYEAHVMILDGEVRRTTMKVKDEEYVEIYDAKRGRRVYLFPDKREFVVVKGFKKAFLPPNPPRVDPVQPDPTPNLYNGLKRPALVNDANRLPLDMVDGISARRFVVEERYDQRPGIGARTRITTTWLEPAANLPLKIEVRDYPTGSTEKGGVFTQRNIVFNAPLDETQFSTDPPAGYTVLPDREYYEY